LLLLLLLLLAGCGALPVAATAAAAAAATEARLQHETLCLLIRKIRLINCSSGRLKLFK
jgi:hypothetical protein